ncbi:hypothetical protein [Cellulomonas edaphi]|uniref:DUF2975 domain-containing protein n=1 Tax=Cellulomonas edaphi TaxID=3053468 RepID=A0ABT7S353_9CELL|nr:hypothetical protein [Cellulomons edaphi]MDM7830045.1 hypothetical protein [Cellulomons edaphi]
MTGPWVRRLANLLVAIGVIGAALGVLDFVNALTQVSASVKATVRVAPSGCCGDARVELPGVTLADGWLLPANGPDGLSASPSAGQLRIEAWGSTAPEQALANAELLVGGVGFLLGALLIRPVLVALSEGRPFRRGNARRITLVAVTVAVTGVLVPLPSQLAGLRIAQRTGLETELVHGVTVPLAPLLTGALVLAVAAAFRAGERLTRESEEMAADLQGLV